MLRRELFNLVGNALQDTSAGGAITLVAARQGDAVLMFVSDTGSGIGALHLPTEFERLY